PFPLDSIVLGTVDPSPGAPTTGTVTLLGFDGLGDILASLTLPVATVDTEFPATTFNAAGTVFAGLQLSSLEIMPDGDSSEQALFNDLSVTRSTPPPLAFSDMAIAANDIKVVDGAGNPVSL